jgi:hypothetical protein
LSRKGVVDKCNTFKIITAWYCARNHPDGIFKERYPVTHSTPPVYRISIIHVGFINARDTTILCSLGKVYFLQPTTCVVYIPGFYCYDAVVLLVRHLIVVVKA